MADNQDTPSRQDLVQQFVGMCNTSPEQATQYLDANEWDLLAACDSFFQDDDEAKMEESQTNSSRPNPEPEYTGPRTLDGRPAPQAASSSGPRAQPKSQPKRTGIATLGSLGGGGGGGGGGSHHHDDDNDDSDDSDDNDGRGNLFAGGEKSGLAVQDPKQQEAGPRKIINDILAKAKANASRPDATPEQAAAAGPSRFRGTGVTLGGEGVESRSIPDPDGALPTARGDPQERLLHIWQDGFSIDDGELRRFDDPANQADLQMIRSGRAPLHLMNVQRDQPVDVKLHQHDTPYKPPPKKYKPFSGAGQRLGSPVPGAGASSTAGATAGAGAAASSSSSSATTATQERVIDSSQPVVTIRIQLPDGSRLPARFNTTNTVGDIYGFIRSASSEISSRSWVLATTFPNKEHRDMDSVLADVPEFSKGGTAVVKWV
ncbi:hypothetical protein E4U54_002190 [Claviceps lovelessii]|nr:hypothetical protein E4U54_002190 [Claviceps lovelessii]